MDKAFAFEIGARVRFKVSGEEAEVIGRAEYAQAEPSYHVRGRGADGRGFETWWSQSAVEAA